jgi:predicted amidophosphoribosyltransferase
MSEPRKCRGCNAPAEFLSAHCKTCAESKRRSNRQIRTAKIKEKLAVNSHYLERRKRHLAHLEHRLTTYPPKP